jgi:hypothetical protein
MNDSIVISGCRGNISGEATNTNFLVFGLTGLGLEPMIYWT